MRLLLKSLLFTVFAACMICTVRAGEKKTVFVSIMPQKYLVEKIAGHLYDVEVMVRPGYSPAVYEPLPSQIRKIGKAEVFFTLSMPFEEIWVPRIEAVYPGLLISDMSEGIKKRAMATAEEVIDKVKEHHKHETGMSDPHIWLNPAMYAQMAEVAEAVLSRHDPENSQLYRTNLKKFRVEMTALDRKIRQILKNIPERSFAVFHPSWGYFAEEYGLHQIPVELSGKEPTPRSLEKIINRIRSGNIKTVFVQKEFSDHIAAYVAEQIGGRVVKLDPLAYDYPANIIRTAELLAGGR